MRHACLLVQDAQARQGFAPGAGVQGGLPSWGGCHGHARCMSPANWLFPALHATHMLPNSWEGLVLSCERGVSCLQIEPHTGKESSILFHAAWQW